MSSYKISEPSALKFLTANGAIVDENGNVVSDATDYWKKVYDQAEPKVAKYLHSDGTIDENPGGGSGSDLEDNHQTTIDVSTYNTPVEVTPTQGKDGMKKVTVTLSNIPSPSGSVTLYAWIFPYNIFVYTLSQTPSVGDDVYGGDTGDYANKIVKGVITEVGDNTITIQDATGYMIPETYTRDSTADITIG